MDQDVIRFIPSMMRWSLAQRSKKTIGYKIYHRAIKSAKKIGVIPKKGMVLKTIFLAFTVRCDNMIDD